MNNVKFKDILNGEEIKGITIPIVQRDYAQGRTSPNVNRIRERFLEVLYKALVNEEPITLDFIYGSKDKEGKLIPLDGQQRLTTLFLLHYYIAKHESIAKEEYSFLANFSYETRISSREFCKHLISYTPDFTQVTLSEQIYDEAWFLFEWDNDPTVQSMMVMLDAIHETFKDTENLWDKLMNDVITFYFLSLEEMGITDEIYIKMNSRGKPLSQFEHFKAELELKMKGVDEDLAKQICCKMDCEWTDLLWPYRNSGIQQDEADNVVDDEFLRYIHFVSDIISYKEGKLEIKDEFDIAEQQFSSACPKAKENMHFLEECFDLWTKIDVKEFLHDYIAKDTYEAGKICVEKRDDKDSIPDLFNECCKSYGRKNGVRPMFPLGRTILLYSFLLYMKYQAEIDDADFRRRLRIVNNLIKNSSNTLRSEFMQVLLSQVDDIIRFGKLEQVEEGKARFQSRQFDEEIEKLQWTTEHPEKAELLFKLEDHKYLNGYIHTIGLEHVDWCERFYSLFSCDLNDVNKALLATGDYFEEDGWRYQIGTSDSRISTNVWRTLFSPLRDSDGLSHVLHKLLAEHEEFTNDLLKDIYSEYLQLSKEMPVRYYLIKYNSMLPNRYGKYYWRDYDNNGRNSYKVIMMITELRFGFNYDIFLKTLYDVAGGNIRGLRIGDYSFSEYNNGQKDKLYLDKQHLYLTLDNNEFSVYNENDELLESYEIKQNERGVDIEDRVEVGLSLLNKYMHDK